MHIIGLDLSLTATGVALAHDETLTVTSKQRGVARLIELRDRIVRLCDAGPFGHVDLVMIEGYSYGSKNSHAHALGELGGIIRVALTEAGIRYVDVPPSNLKKYATGKGNASKGLVLVEAVKRLGYVGSSDNESDALWLREVGLAHCSPAGAADVPALNRTALDGIEFPPGLTVAERADAFLTDTKDAA